MSGEVFLLEKKKKRVIHKMVEDTEEFRGRNAKNKQKILIKWEIERKHGF